jgi:hypothetical protein
MAYGYPKGAKWPNMESKWIDDRYRIFQERLAKERLTAQRHQDAIASYAALFDGLKQQVQNDVNHYNDLFAAHPECNAIFETPTQEGFSVRRAALRMHVKRNNGTVISIEYQFAGRLQAQEPPSSLAINVAANENGIIGYKKNGDFWTDAADVSRVILDQLLCV